MTTVAYSGLFNGVHNESYALLVNQAPVDKIINKFARKSRTGMRKTRALLQGLIGATSGSNVTETFKRVGWTPDVGNAVVGGGSVSIETRTIINRNTTSGDVTAMKAIFSEDSKPAYPTDASGNGGGGQLSKTYSVG